jgi:hypothetical protein
MNAFSIPPIVMASVTFYVGLYHLLVYARQKQHRENLTFALMCFTVGWYDVFCAGLYSARSVAGGFGGQRAQIMILDLVTIASVWFVNDYLSSKPTRWIWALSAPYLLAAIGGLVNWPGAFWLMDQPAVKEIHCLSGLRSPITK